MSFMTSNFALSSLSFLTMAIVQNGQEMSYYCDNYLDVMKHVLEVMAFVAKGDVVQDIVFQELDMWVSNL